MASGYVNSSAPEVQEEKNDISHIERGSSDPSLDKTAEGADFTTLTAQEQKKVIRKIDRRLLPILGLMYSISLVDRTNLGLAMVAGLQTDLRMDIGDRYTIVVMLFFVAYIIFELPSNIVLKKVGPANWLAFLGVSFGAILIGMGFVESWQTLAVCRFLLGVFEAGFLPGCTYLITCWYTRYEIGKRLSAFWILSVVIGGFAAIFAYALTLLAGRGGLNGWQWIFAIEGVITVVVCAFGWFIIVPFPAKAKEKFLTPTEKQFVLDRIDRDRGDSVADPITVRVVLHHLCDWKLYFWGINLAASTLPGYAYSYFLPIILRRGLGFSLPNSQLLSAPPYLFAAIITYISGWLGDKYKIRGPLIAFHQLMTCAGLLITAYAQGNAVRYFGSFLGIGFLQFCIPGVLTYQANNITSQSKRAVSSATCLMGGGIGGIIASVAFKSSESPAYTTGVWTCVGLTLLSCSMIAFMDGYFWFRNRAVRNGTKINEGIPNWYYTY